ncbi:MAG: hypothetical protein FWB75_01145, partial [Oscillospiraceae bacterium]|nr:hypothetical protein [Oscillospiraceae bacterium]
AEPLPVSADIDEVEEIEDADEEIRPNPQTHDNFSMVGLYLSAIGAVLFSLIAILIKRRQAFLKSK